MQPQPSRTIRSQHDPVHLDSVIHKNLNSHECRPATAHLRIQQQHGLVLGDILGKGKVMQFRLARAQITLNQHATGLAVRQNTLQPGLQSGTAAQDDHSRHLSPRLQPGVLHVKGSGDGGRSKRDVIHGLFDQQGAEAVEVEDEVGVGRVDVVDDGVHAAQLGRLVEEDDLVGKRLGAGLRLEAGQGGAVAFGLFEQFLLDELRYHGHGYVVLDAARDDDVGDLALGVDELFKVGLDVAEPLLDDALDVAATVSNVTQDCSTPLACGRPTRSLERKTHFFAKDKYRHQPHRRSNVSLA